LDSQSGVDRNFLTQALVFLLVAAGFTTIYITQPVLPIIEREFGIDAKAASATVSVVILGVALANLPFGMIVDRFPIRPIILIGGSIVAAGSIVCALTDRMWLFIGMRFIQGLFIPSLTTCIAAYLAQTLPAARLNVVMGSYVSATVAGGLGGRLLGGWIHPPLHWRYAFVTSSLLVLVSTIASVIWLPRENHRKETSLEQAGFMDLVVMPGVSRMLIVGFGAFFVFSSIFNYLPFYLSKPPFSARTEVITLLYLAYLVGIIIGPLSGRISNRIGSGATMVSGAVMFGIALASTLIPSLIAIAVSLVGICAGFFSIHAAAVGLLNRRLTSSRGRANSLYVLCYYVGGAVGITVCGYAYGAYGWGGAIGLGLTVLLLPLTTGIIEIRGERR
jgi:YNFM family putative membrane transporter